MASSTICDIDDKAAASSPSKAHKRRIYESENVSTDSPSSPVNEAPLHGPDSPSKKNRTEQSVADDSKSKNKFEVWFAAKVLELLECPVCTEVVRTAPIFCCRAGHLVCVKCKPKVASCPICRSPDLDCRNILVEQIALPVLDETQLKCVNHVFGCKHNDVGKKLQDHLKNCVFEQVHCPASHRNACTWQGNLIQSVAHAAQQKCAQVLRYREENLFRSSIGDFNEGDTVFKRGTRTYWKPVILLSQSVVRYFMYLIIYREGSGDWFIFMRSLAHKDLIKNVQFEMKLSQPAAPDSAGSSSSSNATKGNTESRFGLVGNVHDASVSDGDVIKSGHYLRLSDSQVRTLTRGKTMFEYTISISLRREEEDGTVTIVQIHPRPKSEAGNPVTSTLASAPDSS